MVGTQNRFEIFLKAAEIGNITKTAEALNYTQSGVSHAIAALEKETGFVLFTRSVNGVQLTENGKKILPAVRALVNQQRILRQTIDHVNHRIAGKLRVGAFASFTANCMPAVIRGFQREYPDVTFELHIGRHEEIQKWLQQGRIDCGFLTAPAVEGLDFHLLKKDPLMAALPQEHPLAAREAVDIDDLLDYPFIMQPKGCENDVKPVLRSARKTPRIEYILDDLSSMAMIASGFGVGVFPELVLKKGCEDLAVRPIRPQRYREIGIASQPLDRVSVVTKVFIEFLEGVKPQL